MPERCEPRLFVDLKIKHSRASRCRMCDSPDATCRPPHRLGRRISVCSNRTMTPPLAHYAVVARALRTKMDFQKSAIGARHVRTRPVAGSVLKEHPKKSGSRLTRTAHARARRCPRIPDTSGMACPTISVLSTVPGSKGNSGRLSAWNHRQVSLLVRRLVHARRGHGNAEGTGVESCKLPLDHAAVEQIRVAAGDAADP